MIFFIMEDDRNEILSIFTEDKDIFKFEFILIELNFDELPL